MTFGRYLLGLFAIFSLSFSSCAASEISQTKTEIGLLSIEISQDSVSVIIHNKTSEIVNVLDTLMLNDAKLPPILSFKIAQLDGKGITDLSRLDAETDWRFPPNYREYAFAVSKKRIQVEPDSFIAKSWGLADILGSYASCDGGECLFFVKFEARAYPNEDIEDYVVEETPWFVYTAR